MERYCTLTRNYYNHAEAVVVVYDVKERSSLDHVIRWNKDAMTFAPNAIKMLLGNKADAEMAEIDRQTAENFAENNLFDLHARVSCKTGKGIKEAFEALALILYRNEVDSITSNPFRHGCVRVDTRGNIKFSPAANCDKNNQNETCKC